MFVIVYVLLFYVAVFQFYSWKKAMATDIQIAQFLDAAARGDLNKLAALVYQHDFLINEHRENGWTALMHGARNGHCNIVEYLLEKGCNKSLANEAGQTALDIAKFWGHTHIENLLANSKMHSSSSPSSTSEDLVCYFSRTFLDKMSQKRTDSEWLKSKQFHSSTVYIVFSDLSPLVTPVADEHDPEKHLIKLCRFGIEDVKELLANPEAVLIFLGAEKPPQEYLKGNNIFDEQIVWFALNSSDVSIEKFRSKFGECYFVVSAMPGLLQLAEEEAGETIEDAVRREVEEESGIKVGHVQYIACQPWPMPSSLMIGCLAIAVSTEIKVDKTEIEEAHWFSRQQIPSSDPKEDYNEEQCECMCNALENCTEHDPFANTLVESNHAFCTSQSVDNTNNAQCDEACKANESFNITLSSQNDGDVTVVNESSCPESHQLECLQHLEFMESGFDEHILNDEDANEISLERSITNTDWHGQISPSSAFHNHFDEKVHSSSSLSEQLNGHEQSEQNAHIHVHETTTPDPCIPNRRSSVVTVIVGDLEQRILFQNDSFTRIYDAHPLSSILNVVETEEPSQEEESFNAAPPSHDTCTFTGKKNENHDLQEIQQKIVVSACNKNNEEEQISENTEELEKIILESDRKENDDTPSVENSASNQVTKTECADNETYCPISDPLFQGKDEVDFLLQNVVGQEYDTRSLQDSKLMTDTAQTDGLPKDSAKKEDSDRWAKRRRLFKESKHWSSTGESSITSTITEERESVRERTVRITKGTGDYPWGFRIQFSKPILVTEVDTNGAADEAGLQVGDTVFAVNGTDVTSVPHSEAAALARQGPETLTLVIGSDISRCPNTPRPACRGYLHKRTQSGLLKGWRKRWFVLKHDGYLYYYKNKKSRIVWGRNNHLSLSVEQDSDSSLSLKLLLCLEMILFSGCSGFSMIDRSLLSAHRSVTNVKPSSSVPTIEPAFLTCLSRRETSFFL
ncbi:NUD12 pyrophosphatase, partial [Polypterus senegalus]